VVLPAPLGPANDDDFFQQELLVVLRFGKQFYVRHRHLQKAVSSIKPDLISKDLLYAQKKTIKKALALMHGLFIWLLDLGSNQGPTD
jgi:hypothetical protein